MIEITYSDTEIIVKGHSVNKKEDRCDESQQACASITALTQTLIFGLIELCHMAPYYHLKKGDFYLRVDNMQEEPQLLIDTFLLGCKLVAGAYSDYIKIVQA